nr:hypothetical protein [Thermoactinospora rubra]
MIERFLTTGVAFDNHAIGGRSSKNFLTQGRLDEILRLIRPGDSFLIQFGHNDATVSVPDRYASPADYKEVMMKTADGTVDGTGAVIGNPSRDHRNSGGYVLSGPEYLTVFEGSPARRSTPSATWTRPGRAMRCSPRTRTWAAAATGARPSATRPRARCCGRCPLPRTPGGPPPATSTRATRAPRAGP